MTESRTDQTSRPEEDPRQPYTFLLPVFISDMATRMAERENMHRDLLIRRAIVIYNVATRGDYNLIPTTPGVMQAIDDKAAALHMPTITLAGELLAEGASDTARQALAEENRTLRTALEWYADRARYQGQFTDGRRYEPEVISDEGETARLGLGMESEG